MHMVGVFRGLDGVVVLEGACVRAFFCVSGFEGLGLRWMMVYV